MIIMSNVNNMLSANDYHLLNKDVELCGNYFDVVPDGNLYTVDDVPIFAIRMRPKGIAHIMAEYQEKYGFYTEVLVYKIHTRQYTLYSDDAMQMYNTQTEALKAYFNFDTCNDREFRGVIIVVVNEDDRMIHAIPYLYGMLDGRRKMIFLDPFFAPDMGSGCIVGTNFFYRLYNGNIDCYCHGENVQADHHSCGIIACDFIKNCFQRDGKVLKKILKNVKMRVDICKGSEDGPVWVNIYILPTELRRFTQISHNRTRADCLAEVDDEEEKEARKGWFRQHIRTLIYRKDPEPYNPIGSIIPSQEGVKKDINTSLLEKGHKYAGKIVKDLNQDTAYNSKYWLSLIREQNDGNVFARVMRRARKMFQSYSEN